jgi:hypothetical protein
MGAAEDTLGRLVSGLDLTPLRMAELRIASVLISKLRRSRIIAVVSMAAKHNRETCFAGPLRSSSRDTQPPGRSGSTAHKRGAAREETVRTHESMPLQFKKCIVFGAIPFAQKCPPTRCVNASQRSITLSHSRSQAIYCRFLRDTGLGSLLEVWPHGIILRDISHVHARCTWCHNRLAALATHL